MKKKSASHSVLICLFIVLAFAVYSSPARADTTTWTGASNRDWFSATNWDHGVPTSSTDAFINNGDKVEINRSGATARSLTLGVNQGNSGTVWVNGANGGSLDAVAQACAEGNADPKDGAIYVGYGGTGTLSITNGGRVTSRSGYMAVLTNPVRPVSNGAVKVDGAGSTWTMSGPCSGQFIISGSSKFDPGGTALLSITNGGTVLVENNPSGLEALWVGLSGTLTGDGTITTTSSFRPTTFVAGTLAPSGTFFIETNFRLDFFHGAMLCNVTPQSADRVEVSGFARPGGSLLVIMTGNFTSGPTRYNLLHADLGRGDIEFRSVSIKYPTDQGFEPRISYDTDNVYLDLIFDH